MAVRDMADEVAALMEDRLGIGGRGLAEKLRRGGRLLPRRIRREAGRLARAAEATQNPRLIPLQDMERLRRAHGLCVGHLRPIGLWRRRRGRLADLLAFGVFVVLLAGGAVLALAVWRGPAP